MKLSPRFKEMNFRILQEADANLGSVLLPVSNNLESVMLNVRLVNLNQKNMKLKNILQQQNAAVNSIWHEDCKSLSLARPVSVSENEGRGEALAKQRGNGAWCAQRQRTADSRNPTQYTYPREDIPGSQATRRFVKCALKGTVWFRVIAGEAK
ncbi:Protein of unknown function [Gryllus bimaculatus]|nr:Protein of unknown function [Gryllus bimaculatus]